MLVVNIAVVKACGEKIAAAMLLIAQKRKSSVVLTIQEWLSKIRIMAAMLAPCQYRAGQMNALVEFNHYGELFERSKYSGFC